MTQTCIVAPGRLAREGWARLFQGTPFDIVASVGGPGEIETAEADGTRLELVLFDLPAHLNDVRGIVQKVRAAVPEARLVVLADQVPPEVLAQSFTAGADGFLNKDMSYEAMIESLRLVMLGEKVFPSRILADLVNGAGQGGPYFARPGGRGNLSAREVEILRCLVTGHSNKMIGNRLNITETTVKVHLKSILRKIGAANRTQAAIWAFGRGFTGIDEGPEPKSPPPAARR